MQNQTKYKWLNQTQMDEVLYKQYKFGCKQKIDIHLPIYITCMYNVCMYVHMYVITCTW